MLIHTHKDRTAEPPDTERNHVPVGTPPALTGHILRFEMVGAVARPATVETCYRKKLACYSRFSAGAASASVPLQETDPKCLHVVTAIDCASHDIVGSVSIYSRTQDSALPMESAIGGLPRLQPEIASWDGHHVVELSGLWVDAGWRKTGLSEQLMLVAFAAAHRLRADKIVGFSHQHVLAFYGSVGLIPDLSLGQYAYPDASYVSTLVWGDPNSLATLPAQKRPMVKRYADCIAFGQAILWRNFNSRFAPVR